MAAARVGDDVAFAVDVDVSGGDVLLFKFSAERDVHFREKLRRIGDVLELSGERHFHHRGDQRGADAVAGDIGDQNAETLRAIGKEVVEVAGD